MTTAIQFYIVTALSVTAVVFYALPYPWAHTAAEALTSAIAGSSGFTGIASHVTARKEAKS